MEIIKPKKHLFICTRNRDGASSSCEDKKASELVLALKQEVRARGLTQDIFITSSGCLGYCQMGITAVLYPQGDFWFEVEKLSVDQILSRLNL